MCRINCGGGCPECSPEDHTKQCRYAWAYGSLKCICNEHYYDGNSINPRCVCGEPLPALCITMLRPERLEKL